MDSRKIVFQETAVVALGQIVCVGAMLGVYALLGKFSNAVLFGSLLGAAAAILNFLFMAIGTSLAADRAQAQNVKGGKLFLQISFLVRYAVLFIVLFAAAKSGYFDPFTLVLPLIFVRPTLYVGEFFRKKGDNAA